jgi:hypothetical protein
MSDGSSRLAAEQQILYNVSVFHEQKRIEDSLTHKRTALMYNVLQPVVDFTNANIETLSRFANSREVTELAKDSASKYLELVQDNMAKIARSDAFATCLRTTIDNYIRFANEYTKNVYGIVSQSQEFVTRQVEEGNRRFAQVADISGRAVQAGTESMKSAGEEALNEADQAGRARNRGK